MVLKGLSFPAVAAVPSGKLCQGLEGRGGGDARAERCCSELPVPWPCPLASGGWQSCLAQAPVGLERPEKQEDATENAGRCGGGNSQRGEPSPQPLGC